ncbi:hypothetical protein [Methylobacterium radiodurans]|uniref:MxaH protein n=1 Tax=Methylobacterium radiodurans TaxID=2202828 RepID=A0A2U8VZ05_9HYPH|nr:hypothetical protein [Methylobacterium radiodurans]AWN38688.1 hypothetical protein DK427_25610 [Methylobacterium radiodurans]
MRRQHAFLVLVLAISGCGEGAPEPEPEPVAARDGGMAIPAEWLGPTDPTEPALWLARRAAGDGPVDPGMLAGLRTALAAARARFVEDPRMIANRTAQLDAMLAEINATEDPVSLIGALTGIASASERRQLYGELCQHYATVRRAGLGRDAALARLRERYAAQDRP